MHARWKRGITDLVDLDQDHPGFRDADYRARRNAIARIALEYASGDPVPDVAYTDDEHDVWRTIWRHLRPLHDRCVVEDLARQQRHLALGDDRIPQLRAVNARLASEQGLRMEPVAGLVGPRTFLEFLGRGVFLSTQYIRHPSRPFYTPEPDVVHELVGHAASLMHPGVAAVSRLFGRAVAGAADDDELTRLMQTYWYTLEFGVAREGGRIKAFGAGLLSSCGELEQLDAGPELHSWDLDVIARTPFDPTEYQARIFVAPSFVFALRDLSDWLQAGRWRS